MAQTSNHVNVILKHKLWKSCASKWVHVVTINKPMIYLCGREGKNLGLTKKKKKTQSKCKTKQRFYLSSFSYFTHSPLMAISGYLMHIVKKGK